MAMNYGEDERNLTQMIEEATQELQLGPDWAANIQICDRISQNPEINGQEATKALYKRLDSSKVAVQYLALKVAETCVKNCELSFHRLLGNNKKFMELMQDLASGEKNEGFFKRIGSDLDTQRKKDQVKEQALVLIRSWGEGFISVQHEVPLFVETYQKMRMKGVHFPELNEEDRNIFTPPASIPAEVPAYPQHDPVSPVSAAMGQLHDGPVHGAVVQGVAAANPPGPQGPANAGGIPDLDNVREQCTLFKEVCGAID